MRKVVTNLVIVVAFVLALWLVSEPNTQSSLTMEDLIARSDVKQPATLAEKLPKKVAVDVTVILERPCHGTGYGKYTELLWLACAIYHEARGESLEGQLAVAQSILVRVADRRWPNTVAGVVSQCERTRAGKLLCQYSFMYSEKSKSITEVEAWMQALRVAQYALAQQLFGKQSTCAHSYHADWMNNQTAAGWFATLKREKQIGKHIFFCDQKKIASKV